MGNKMGLCKGNKNSKDMEFKRIEIFIQKIKEKLEKNDSPPLGFEPEIIGLG